MRTIEIKVDIYNSVVYFVIGGSKKQIISFLEKHMTNAEEMMEAVSNNAASTLLHSGKSIVIASANKTQEEFFSEIAHEIFHVTCWIMKYVGITLSDESEEAFAYLNGYITEQFYKKSK